MMFEADALEASRGVFIGIMSVVFQFVARVRRLSTSTLPSALPRKAV
jgi:hypothetical protein